MPSWHNIPANSALKFSKKKSDRVCLNSLNFPLSYAYRFMKINDSMTQIYEQYGKQSKKYFFFCKNPKEDAIYNILDYVLCRIF